MEETHDRDPLGDAPAAVAAASGDGRAGAVAELPDARRPRLANGKIDLAAPAPRARGRAS